MENIQFLKNFFTFKYESNEKKGLYNLLLLNKNIYNYYMPLSILFFIDFVYFNGLFHGF